MKRILSLILALLVLGGQGMPAFAEETAPGNVAAVDFSLKLLARTVESGEQNIVISPLSAYLALSMAAVGARGETAEEFAAVLGIQVDALPAYCAELTRQLQRVQGKTILSIANSGWLDERFAADPAYLKIITSDMEAEVFVRDLDTDAARAAINEWVKGETRGLIPSLLDENLPEDAALALVNTLYFKGRWADQFDPNATADYPFYPEGGAEVAVPFLVAREEDRLYIAADGAEGVLLPYDDGKTALLALRATDGRSARELARSLTPESFAGYVAAAEKTFLSLWMPKFTLTYAVTMNDALVAMGMPLAFDPVRADFGGMGESPDGNVSISEVLQKVKIAVHEKGTEAAAATAITMRATSAMPTREPLLMRLDSPFVYAAVDLETGIPLFIGCLDDPSLSEAN